MSRTLNASSVGRVLRTVAALAALLPTVTMALPVYQTKLVDQGSVPFATGTTPTLSAGTSVAGGGFVSGTVYTDEPAITLHGEARTGGGTTAGIDVFGKYTVDDVVFTDTVNPGAGGNVDVSVNVELEWDDTSGPPGGRVIVTTGLHTEDLPEESINTRGTHQRQYLNVSVPLNIQVRFSLRALLVVGDRTQSHINPDRNFGDAVFRFTGFALDPGFTANSQSLGLVDNVIGGASPAPAPATFYLLLAGLGAAIRFRRKLT